MTAETEGRVYNVSGQDWDEVLAAAGEDLVEVLEAFCLEYYGSAPSVPPQVLVPEEVGDVAALEGFLSELRGSRVEVRVPERGEKRRLQELAQQNASFSSSTFASLPAGNYSLSLVGHGRAALGWDFTNGAVENFPDNETLVAFLAPSGPGVQVYVSRGNAQTIELSMYGDDLLPVGNATASADGSVTFVLPPSAASVAYLVARVTAGAPNGIYGLSWTSGPLNPPLDFTAWPLFLLWILVPVAVAFGIFVLLQRRRAR